MEDTLTEKVLGLTERIGNSYRGLSILGNPFAVVDLLIISVLIYYSIVLLKETRAIRIFYGIILLGMVYIVGQLFDLVAVKYIFTGLATTLLIAILIIFQPEIRAALERLGRSRFVGDFSRLGKSEVNSVIDEIVYAVSKLAAAKTGALIVIGRVTGLRDYIETGLALHAKLSAQLILSIFNRSSPLHDGAVVIVGNYVAAASVVLPLSDSKFDSALGMRHRAAVGVSSQTDALVIAVSEQSGSISVAIENKLNKVKPEDLERVLRRELHSKGG